MSVRIPIILLTLYSGASMAADYLTAGADAGRTGWLKDDKSFSTRNVGDMKLLWKTKLDSTPRQMHNLFPPLVLSSVDTSGGSKELVITAGISDDLFAVDAATGDLVWSRKFESTYTPTNTGGFGGQGGTLCPGGQLAAPAAAKNGAGDYTIYALSWDGRLWQLDAANGKDLKPPMKYTPPNAKPWSLNLVDGVIYTGISQGCGGVPFSFISYDLATDRVSGFLPGGGGLWGRRGPAVDDDGVAWMGTGDGYYEPEAGHYGNAAVAVKTDENQLLNQQGWWAPPDMNWQWRRDLDMNVSPIAINYGGKRLLINANKTCVLWVADLDEVTNMDMDVDHTQMVAESDQICNAGGRYDSAGVWGSIAAWEENDKLYVAVPFWGPLASTFKAAKMTGTPDAGGVAVFSLDSKTWKLKPEWTYGDMAGGDEALYANGVLFVNGAGEDAYQRAPERAWDEEPYKSAQEGMMGSGTRIANSTHATIYAFNAATGKLLWSSGDQITSWNHFSGISAANGKVYIGTFDGNLYAFGVEE